MRSRNKLVARRSLPVNATNSAILNALPAHVALLDPDGVILAVNAGWRKFADANGLADGDACVGANYLEICDSANGASVEDEHRRARGLLRQSDGG